MVMNRKKKMDHDAGGGKEKSGGRELKGGGCRHQREGMKKAGEKGARGK